MISVAIRADCRFRGSGKTIARRYTRRVRLPHVNIGSWIWFSHDPSGPPPEGERLGIRIRDSSEIDVDDAPYFTGFIHTEVSTNNSDGEAVIELEYDEQSRDGDVEADVEWWDRWWIAYGFSVADPEVLAGVEP